MSAHTQKKHHNTNIYFTKTIIKTQNEENSQCSSQIYAVHKQNKSKSHSVCLLLLVYFKIQQLLVEIEGS